MGKQITTITSKGFTIVELVIIVIVIAILASITIVSYNAVTRNSHIQSVTADLSTSASELAKFRADTGSYPTSQAQFNTQIKQSNTSGETVYTYTYTAASNTYCLSATGHSVTYNVRSNRIKAVEGPCV